MPDFKVEIRARLAELRLSPVREAEIVEELSQHLEQDYERSVNGGASTDEARRINEFLGGRLNVEQMSTVADRELYRNRKSRD